MGYAASVTLPPPTRAEDPSWASTLRALGEPRRALPIASASAALVGTEWFATHSAVATASLAAFLVAFVLTVPAASRWARAGGLDPVHVTLYGLLCALLVGVTTLVLPASLHFESYVAHPPAAIAIFGLASIAGWVLGRDIDLAAGLSDALEHSALLTRETEDARLLALRQHLDPHFLFNTLQAIAEWCREDPAVAEQALLELSRMLRTLFEGIRVPFWPLSRELDVLLALQRLYALRDDERYALVAELMALGAAHETSEPASDPTGEGARTVSALPVPPLVLLPLFENALTHGGAGAPLRLSVTAADGTLRVRLWNAGAFAGMRAGGTGIETVERRLALAYGSRASLQVMPEAWEGVAGTATVVTLPLAKTTPRVAQGATA